MLNFIQKPDSISLVGNMNHVVIAATGDVTLTLSLDGAAAGDNIFVRRYTPDANGRIEVNLYDAVYAQLAFVLSDTSAPYYQTGIVKTFRMVVAPVSGSEASDSWIFTAIRAGIDNLADTAQNFLAQNFLTWQPTVKGVTYYTPEFLTYFNPSEQPVNVKIRAHIDGETELTYTLTGVGSMMCLTIPTNYATIAAFLAQQANEDELLPQWYDIWVENSQQERLTYIQRYYAQNMQSEEEEWILFENSLGGIDTFRAYGDAEHTAEHTHNVAEIEEVSEEYRVDTNRKHKKNTGHLDNYERRWLLDFFPSTRKYIYTAQALRQIVVTESNVSYKQIELPSSYSFTYKYADAKPYLNLPRTEMPLQMLSIDMPELSSFTVAPRLVEFPRTQLSDGALFPVQAPYSESWGATTFGAIVDFLKQRISGDGNSEYHTHENLSFLNQLSWESIRNFFSGIFLSKTSDDVAEGHITFKQGLSVGSEGEKGIDSEGNALLGEVAATGDLTAKTLSATGENEQGLSLQALRDGVIGRLLLVYESIRTKMLQSFNFTGGDSLAGTGWQLTDEDGTGHSRLIVDNLSVRMKATFNELEVRKLTTMGGNYCFSPAASQIEEVDYLDAEGNVLGYEYMKRPWLLRLMPSFLRDNNRMNILSRRKLVRTKMTDAMWDEVAIYRCWLKADDGSTRTINTWRTGMLARCQTFDTKQMQSATHEGEYATAGQTWTGKNVTTKLYWRAVIATGEQIHKSEYELPAKVLQDNLYHNYIDLSNDPDLCLPGSDRPQAGDQVVCYGDYLNIETSNIITIETVGADAPSFKELVGVGYTDGEHPSWSLDGKMKTRISPTAGNRFVAPEFIVETDGGTPESLYNQHDKGEAKGITTAAAAEATENPNDGDLYLITDVVTANYMLTYDEANDEWVGTQATLGDCYVSLADGHRYMATVTGWQDMGLVSENHSSLKVGIDGIRTEVSSKTSQSEVQSMIDQSAESITQSVTQSVSGQLANYSTIQQTANAITSAVTQEAGRAHVAGRALGIDTAENVEAKEEPTDGDRYLVSDQLNGYMLTYNEDDDEWTGSNATLGDCYVCQSNSHLYCAVTTGWEDRGLYSEAKLQSQIQQTANSISLKVTQVEGNVSDLSDNVSDLSGDVRTTKENLVSTGIDIEHRKITMTADNFTLKNNSNEQIFGVNAQGDLEVKGTIRAKNLYNALCLFGGGNTAADAIYSLRCYYIVRKPVIDPDDPNPTLPFRPEDEDMETASKNFWDALTAGRYYTGEEIDALKEANKVNGVSPYFAEEDTEGTLWRPCTGNANIVQLIPATQGYGYTGDDGNTKYPVILPCAKDYPGKVVEITGWTRRQSGEEYFYVGSADNKMKGDLTANAEGRFVFTNETPATLTFWTGGIYLLYSYSTDGQNYYWVNLGSKTV